MRSNFFEFKLYPFPEQAKPWEGTNEKGLSLFIAGDATEAGSVEYLQKILQAVHYELEKDTHYLFLTAGASISFLSQVPSRRSMIFGISPERLGLNVRAPLYQPFVLQQYHLLFADPLSVLLQERQAGKKQKAAALWQSMRVFFKQ